MTTVEQRILGRTGRRVSVVGLGTWQLGADWGAVSERDALDVLEASAAAGVTFFDTADAYGDGRSEQLIGTFLAAHPDAGITVATKMGRRLPQVTESYTMENFRAWTDRSRRNLRVDTLDLVQLHCPPSAVIDAETTYDALDALVDAGAIAAYGVSVETVDQALTVISRPHVAAVQIVLTVFRRKPLERVLPAAEAAGVGIIARVPLASGLLSGKYDRSTTFTPDDHRSYNRDGSAFDVGETFAGVPWEVGLLAAQEFVSVVDSAGPPDATPAQVAIAWCWQQPGVTTVIPGARTVDQAIGNAGAGVLPPLTGEFERSARSLYDAHLREAVHGRW